jgi:hypothetical protein
MFTTINCLYPLSSNTNLHSESFGSVGYSDTCPLQINGPGYLRDFNTFQPRPYKRSFDLLLDQRSISPSELWCFHPLLSSGVLHTQNSRSGTMCPLSNQRFLSALGLRASVISNLNFPMLCFSRSVLSRVRDLMTCFLS